MSELLLTVVTLRLGTRAEEKVASWLARNEQSTGVPLSAGQRAAIEAAAHSPLVVLTGGPGCGKTFAVRTVVKLWRVRPRLHLQVHRLLLAWPVGVAAGLQWVALVFALNL